MGSSNSNGTRLLYGVVALYGVTWLLLMSHLQYGIWLGIALPVTLTYCGVMAHTMFVHGRIWLSADIPALPAALLVMAVVVAVCVTSGWLEWRMEMLVTALARFGGAWFGSHLGVMLLFLVADKMGWDKEA